MWRSGDRKAWVVPFQDSRRLGVQARALRFRRIRRPEEERTNWHRVPTVAEWPSSKSMSESTSGVPRGCESGVVCRWAGIAAGIAGARTPSFAPRGSAARWRSSTRSRRSGPPDRHDPPESTAGAPEVPAFYSVGAGAGTRPGDRGPGPPGPWCPDRRRLQGMRIRPRIAVELAPVARGTLEGRPWAVSCPNKAKATASRAWAGTPTSSIRRRWTLAGIR